MSVELRPLLSTDYGEVIGKVDDWWGGRSVAPMLPKLFFVHFPDTSFAAVRRDRVVGFLCGFLSAASDDTAYIHFVGVDPDVRGGGTGRRLYEAFFEAVRRAGRVRVQCVTSPGNAGSRAFHERMGFRGQEIDSYDGRGENRILFTLALV